MINSENRKFNKKKNGGNGSMGGLATTDPEISQWANEAQLKTLFDEMPLGVYLIDSDFRIRAVNPTALPVFGQIPNLIGRDYEEVIHIIREPQYADEIVRLFRHTLETGEPYYAPEQLIKEREELKSSEYFEWQINRISMAEGGYGVVCYFRDISAAVQTRLSIAESKTELIKLNRQIEQQAVIFNTTLSTITDYVYRLDRNGRFIYANQALLDLWGIKELDSSGISMADLNYPKEVEEKVIDGVRRVFETKHTVKDQTAYTSPTGASEYHEFIFNPVFAEDGSVDFIIGSSRDISEHKKLESALKEADRRKDEFLATLAHELRNPLAPIRTGLEIIRRFEAGIPPPIKNTLDVIERQTNQIVRLVDDLLDISRITQGKIKLRKERIEIKTAVEMAVESCRDALESNKHRFDLILPDQTILIDADITRISQIILNVLNNAAKYTPEGGQISLNVKTDEQEALIIIRDSGIGIPKEMIPRIFDLFSQLETIADQARSGLGIGLSVAKELTEMHGGTITAFSEGAGKGSEFIIRLPLAEKLSDESPEFETNAAQFDKIAPEIKRKRILVVDDNADAAAMLKLLLEMEGYAVEMVFDAETAIEKALDFQPVACLCDIGLPVMSGYELAQNLRRMMPEVLLISISGWGQDDDRRRSEEAGFNYHLVKPVSFDDLIPLVREIDN
jgi:PAS domain S-box-containing protein